MTNDESIASVRATLESYGDVLLRRVAANLIKARTVIPGDELADRILATLANTPMIDRRMLSLSPAARALPAVMHLAHQCEWKIGHLLQALAACGFSEGMAPVIELFEIGFLYPVRDSSTPLADFEPWLTQAEPLERRVFAPESVVNRSPWSALNIAPLGEKLSSLSPRVADGQEWFLRLAVAVQFVQEGAVRRTQSGQLFKRDAQRLAAHAVLSARPTEGLYDLPDLGVLALEWAVACGWLLPDGDTLTVPPVRPVPPNWPEAIRELLAGLVRLDHWDPLRGYDIPEGTNSSFPSCLAATLGLLASAEDRWLTLAEIANWLWSQHPSWSGFLPAAARTDRGVPWADALVCGLLYPLGLVAVEGEGVERRVRLSPLGLMIVAGGPAVPEPPSIPQALLVQPNAQILAYRQALTPALVRQLNQFATWTQLGAACTLELTAEQAYRGLESGLTLAGIVQTLNRHGSRPVPAAVNDLLQRWSSKRERIGVYTSATLIEFQSPADLDDAIQRGLVAIRVTDRLGLCSDGNEPDFKQLRLTGNRDYDLRPNRCVTVAEDGVTLHIDSGQSDLLFEAEIGRLAIPKLDSTGGRREFSITPGSLRSSLNTGWSIAELEAWFEARTGAELPAACRLFLSEPGRIHGVAERQLVVRFDEQSVIDGAMQWPATRPWIEERLGPKAIVVREENLPKLAAVLHELGIGIDIEADPVPEE